MSTFTVEDEVVYLRSICSLIDAMVNPEVMSLCGDDSHCEVYFHTPLHQKYFSIVLVDFLSGVDKSAWPNQMPYLRALRRIVESPSFATNDSIKGLRNRTHEFVYWLEDTPDIDIWLPTIDVDTTVGLSRKVFLKMCGNISKHNFLRASRVARDLREALERAGHTITIEDALLSLSDFYERFHNDILNYHASTIAEFLNNIRWGIQEYLESECERSVGSVAKGSTAHEDICPKGVANGFARSCYWDLMTAVRSGPKLPKFRVAQHLKCRY